MMFRVRNLEKGSLRRRRGAVVGPFFKVSNVSKFLMQDISKPGKVQFSKSGSKAIGFITT